MNDKKNNLTPRQMDVAIWMARGKSNKAIAKKLFICSSTVKSHLTEVYKKFGVTNRTEATRKLIDKGIIPPQDSEHP